MSPVSCLPMIATLSLHPRTREMYIGFRPGRGERVLAGAAVVVRRTPLGIDHALATESVQRLIQGGAFAAPRSCPPEDQIGRRAQGRRPRTPRRGSHPGDDPDFVFAVGNCGPRHARGSECVTLGAKTRDG